MAKKSTEQGLVAPSVASEPRRWRNAIVGHAEVDPRTLTPNPHNWRIHSRFQSEAVAGSLDKLGWIAPITVNTTTGHLVDGHDRLNSALEMGEPLVPVDYVTLTEEQEALALAVRDPLGALAETNAGAYVELLASLDTVDGALGELLEDMRQRHFMGEPPSMDELAGKHQEPTDDAFWPKLSLALPPDVYERFQRVLRAMLGETDAERFAALLDAAEGNPGND